MKILFCAALSTLISAVVLAQGDSAGCTLPAGISASDCYVNFDGSIDYRNPAIYWDGQLYALGGVDGSVQGNIVDTAAGFCSLLGEHFSSGGVGTIQTTDVSISLNQDGSIASSSSHPLEISDVTCSN